MTSLGGAKIETLYQPAAQNGQGYANSQHCPGPCPDLAECEALGCRHLRYRDPPEDEAGGFAVTSDYFGVPPNDDNEPGDQPDELDALRDEEIDRLAAADADDSDENDQ